MSSDIYSKPDLSHKVRYTRNTEEDGTEWTETCIYENTDDMEDYYIIPQPQEVSTGQQIQNQPVVKKKAVRRATLCKGVLCIVVLSGLIILCIYFTVKFRKLNYICCQQLQEYLANNSQLQTNHNQLTIEVKQLKDMAEVNKMQLNYENQSFDLFKDEVKQLKDKLKEKWCPKGWIRFGCSCYFKFNETKSWLDSRTDCQQKGADLVIINTEEEQKFVADLNHFGEAWIGLKDTGKWVKEQGTYEWKWVDGSPLTKTFWETEWPRTSTEWQFATCCSPRGKWKHSHFSVHRNWICEK